MTRGIGIVKATSKAVLSNAQVRQLLRHREPFLFISQCPENEIGRSVTAMGPQLSRRTHILEAMAQATSVMIRQMDRYKMLGQPVLAGMSDVRWMDQPEGENATYMYRSEIIRARDRFVVVRASAVQGGKTLCCGQLVASFAIEEAEL